MSMEEIRTAQINEVEDDFYEKIEAPKFVDFTEPDHYHPDDSYWFCLRVGCDKKHEEELDLEAINKNFVLRVMAARSPNVRLRKVLNMKRSSANLKCPLTAPAKSSKSRMSRLAMISSMSHKVIDDRLKARPVAKTSSTATPNAKVKKPSVVDKALTTPRNPKGTLNADKFRSVQNHKPASVIVPKNKVVSKALIFHSPKKVKTKYSVELNTPVKKLCSAMKKLEIKGGKEKNLARCKQPLPIASSRKQLRGREVKSRVFDSLNSHRSKCLEGNSSRCLSEKERPKGSSRLPQCLQAPKGFENDFSDMVVDEKSRNGSLKICTEYVPSGKFSEGETKACTRDVESSAGEAPTEVSSDASRGENTSVTTSEANDVSKCRSLDEELNKASDESKKMEEVFHSLNKLRCPPVITNDNEKEITSASDDKENFCKVNEHEGAENHSACNVERKLHLRKHCVKTMTPIKDECFRKTQKKCASTTTGSQVAKNRKPKPTNPKPFKLRTDERGILKEANMEKGLLTPSKKIKSASLLKREQTPKKHNLMGEDSENHSGKSDDNTVVATVRNDRTNEKKKVSQTEIMQSTPPNKLEGKMVPKMHCRRFVSERMNQKQTGVCQEKVDKLENSLRRRKSPVTEPKFARPQWDVSTKKEKTPLRTPSQLAVIEENSPNVSGPGSSSKPLCENGVLREIQPISATRRSLSRGKTHTTIPKEPLFHSIHVPKSCTRKLTQMTDHN